MLAALAFALATAPPSTLVLSRGVAISSTNAYWGVEDTYLDSGAPDENFGGSFTMLGGPGKTVLIRFGDLDRAVGPGKRIRDARLILSPLGDKPVLKSVAMLKAPWHEGPVTPLTTIQIGAVLDPKKPEATPEAPRWSATWRYRRSNTAPWQDPGGIGSADAESIPDAKLEMTDEGAVIGGLGPAFEKMRARWYDNDGLALTFVNAVEFFSSESGSGKPRLVLELEDASPKAGADLSVVSIDESISGSDRTFTAHVKNVGDQPAKPFSASWFVAEKGGATVDVPQALAPGQETTLVTHRSEKADNLDHRVQPVSLRITPSGDDANPGNDALEIQEDGFAIDLAIPASVAETIRKQPNVLGSTAPEDWAQALVRVFNDVYCPLSRYSFAPDGALERVRLASVTLGDAPKQGSGVPVVLNPAQGSERGFLQAIGQALGLPDQSGTQVLPGFGRVAIQGFTMGTVDRFPGLMGGGDTRYEGTIPGSIWLPYEPRHVSVYEEIPVVPTFLLSATEVATLNANLGKSGAERQSFGKMPSVVMVKAVDSGGRPIPGVEVDFFQTDKGRIDGAAPAFTVATSDTGVAILPRREGGPFGKLERDGGNGVFLLRTTVHGVTGYNWLKAWQLEDAYARGNTATVIVEMPFNVSNAPLDTATDLAANKIVSDSSSTPAAKLNALIDGNPATDVALPDTKGGWVEIDLGRDRTIGEIDLFGKAAEFWKRFEIQVYGTGVPASQADTWAYETDGLYTATNRSENLDDVREVAYRNSGARIRYVRIVNRAGGPGRLSAIRVIPAVVGG